MSEIPPDITSSAAQAGYQAREVAKERDARRAGGADARQRVARSVDEVDTTVDTEDADAAVFTDSEGQGGLGRSSEEQSEGDDQCDAESNATDQDESEGPGGIDIQA